MLVLLDNRNNEYNSLKVLSDKCKRLIFKIAHIVIGGFNTYIRKIFDL